ncbi:Nn.00g095950.m01.CDS01 [Neocucurbitaria sp. VM-36]
MASSTSLESEHSDLIDDIFDGWLAIPSITGFLADRTPSTRVSPREITPQELTEHTPNQSPHVLTLHVEDDTDQSGTSSRENIPITIRGERQRRGHTKSRLGCVTCKKRRIKCQETWPSCANCIKRGYVCRYPTGRFPLAAKDEQRGQIAFQAMNPRRCVQLSDTPTTFTSDDMRLFHHYLTEAYPCIPHDYDAIWLREVPMYSHQNTYLMHALLALAGSHLAIQVDHPQNTSALSHRQKAITGLEGAFTKWPPSAEEAHVMLATSYLLSFQSSYLEDGFLDSILSLRGCAFLSQLVCSHGLEGLFPVSAKMQSPTMDSTFRHFPQYDQELACEALQSLAKVSRLMASPTTSAIEKALVAHSVETVRPLLEVDRVATSKTAATPDVTNASSEATMFTEAEAYTRCQAVHGEVRFMNPLFPADLSLAFDDIDWDNITVPPTPNPDPIGSFNAMMSTLLILTTWPYDDIVHVLSPTNQLGNVIMAHFCAIRAIVSPLSAPKAALKSPVKAVIEWTTQIIVAVEDDEDVKWTEYIEWPKKILRCLRACVSENKGLKFGDLRNMIINDPGAFKEGRARRVREDDH